MEYLWQVLYNYPGFVPYYLANKNKLADTEEKFPEEQIIIDEVSMIKLTNKIKNAIIHYIMNTWDELHKNDQPPIITKIIEDEIEVLEEKFEKTNSKVDSNQNNLITFGEEESKAKLLPQSNSLNIERERSMNEGTYH